MTNDLRRIAVLLFLAKKSQVVINQNLIFGMLFVFGGMILSIVAIVVIVLFIIVNAILGGILFASESINF